MSIHKETKYLDDAGHEFNFDPIEDTIDIKKVKEGFESRYLTRDESPVSPDEWDDDNLFLVHYHRDFTVDKPDIIQKEELADWYRDEKISQEDDFHIFPVSAYIHSGVHLELGKRGFGMDPGGWDTSHVGATLASRKEWEKEDKAENASEGLVEEWNKFLSGDVYCLVKEALDKNKKVIDSEIVCGYYGYDDAKEELRGI